MDFQWLNSPSNFSATPGRLVLSAPGKTDWFIDPDGGGKKNDAPVALFDTPRGDFSLTALVEMTGGAFYDAGALFLYRAEDRWIKVAREITDIGHIAAVSVVTDGVSDDANGEVTGDGPCYLMMSRRGDLVGLHWRPPGGGSWRMVRLLRFPAASTATVGFTAQSPVGEGCTVVFSEIEFLSEAPKEMRKGV